MRCMWPYGIVVAPRALDDDLSLRQCVEDLSIEQFVTQTSIKALDVSVLPGAAGLDVGGLGTDSFDPLLHRLGHELRTIIGADVTRDATQDEQVGQHVDHVDSLELAVDTDRQAFVGELVEDIEHAEPAAVMGAILDEVIGPHMIGMLAIDRSIS